jgi:3-oxoacyl-[acyl-carrier protein] reductase
MTSELAGRAAFVTGASRNIGRAIALELAAAGAAVAISARESRAEAEAVRAEIEAAGGRAIVAMADIVDPQAVAAAVVATERAFGRLDILVNNAAIRGEKPFAELDHATWRRVLEVCLDGAFHCTKACLPALRASGQGAIVNIGGLTGHTGAVDRAHVVTAKAGLAGLTRALAHDLAPDITVNCVSPGMMDTVRKASSAHGQPAHHATRATLAGRRGKPEEIAAAIRWLVGPAGRFVTGQTIHVNGGVFMGG